MRFGGIHSDTTFGKECQDPLVRRPFEVQLLPILPVSSTPSPALASAHFREGFELVLTNSCGLFLS